MPVFVEWKWKERTKTFLVIFHFYDDFSKPNLRIKKYEKEHLLMFTESEMFTPLKAWMTWAPSHPEMALLTQLLTYTNIINGLKEDEKHEIGLYLERAAIPERKLVVVYLEESGELSSFAELCPEYIDYLKKILKPYLRD